MGNAHAEVPRERSTPACPSTPELHDNEWRPSGPAWLLALELAPMPYGEQQAHTLTLLYTHIFIDEPYAKNSGLCEVSGSVRS